MIDLSFGDPVIIRQQLKSIYSLSSSSVGYRMDDECEQEIVKWVRSYYKNNFHKEYKHIILSHGANGALHNLISVLKHGNDYFSTHDMAFAWYKRLFKMEGVFHAPLRINELKRSEADRSTIYVVDTPSNPYGDQILNKKLPANSVIWDSVYASSLFMNAAVLDAPDHFAMVGSFSKIFGLSGLRIGWIGTDDDFLAEKLKSNVLTTYCGLSTPSLEMAASVIDRIDILNFNKIARLHLDFNREEFNKLKNIFNMECFENGMFYLGYLDNKNKEILERSEVKGMVLTNMDKVEHIRFNIADDYVKTKNAIKAILKADKI